MTWNCLTSMLPQPPKLSHQGSRSYVWLHLFHIQQWIDSCQNNDDDDDDDYVIKEHLRRCFFGAAAYDSLVNSPCSWRSQSRIHSLSVMVRYDKICFYNITGFTIKWILL